LLQPGEPGPLELGILGKQRMEPQIRTDVFHELAAG
jgi:hypothetical protein